MKEVMTSDKNYSDGKDYFYREKLGEGAVVYYFQSGNSSSAPRTVNISEKDVFEWHYDIALFMILFLLPVLYFVNSLRKVVDNSSELTVVVKNILGKENRKKP